MFHRLFVAAATLCLAVTCLAQDARTIRWADLQPDSPELRKEIAQMNPEQKRRLAQAVQQYDLNNMLKRGQIKASQLLPEENKLLQADYRDLSGMVERIATFEKRRTSEMMASMSGQNVQIDGYLLPLSLKDKKVTEFLLVPVIGACIHVPPPPPNQMVVVKFPAGYSQSDMFAPVTISGKLAVKPAKANLYLVDGSSSIDVGYAMTADAVRPFVKPTGQ